MPPVRSQLRTRSNPTDTTDDDASLPLFVGLDGIENLATIIPGLITPKKDFDFSPMAKYNGILLQLANIPTPLPLESFRVAHTMKDARSTAQKVLKRYNSEVLEYVSPHPFQFFEEQRSSYLGVQKSSRKKYQDFMEAVGAERESVFADVLPNPYSTRVFDVNGVKLLSSFQYAAPEDLIAKNRGVFSTTGVRELVTEQPGLLDASPGHNHMIPKRFLHQALHGTQSLLSVVPLERPDSGDRRHGAVDRSLQRSHYNVHRGWKGEGELRPERCGVLHCVGCWPQVGHPNHVMTPSASFSANSTAGNAHERYYEETAALNAWLDELFKHEFPKHHAKFKKAHAAGRWSEVDPGPHLGRVIVWKLQSKDHIDDADACPTITYVLGGNYSGGYMDLKDIRTRFLYPPGSVIMGFYGYLWHRVTDYVDQPCEPTEEAIKFSVTPGRVATVNYFPTGSFKQLHDKTADWGRRTDWGRRLDPEEVHSEDKSVKRKKGRGGVKHRRQKT
ncbi:hypothetical protein D9757_015416 [Collybiopsis confluens]|uniref:Uncharacterized protein n=1 Tax=Collybiopsis confluens TaxID=2823264 RepID=A0A8H5C541_9AGAR|nr:hypothetical protein D9757_015416 [Collybiopsis confluens]